MITWLKQNLVVYLQLMHLQQMLLVSKLVPPVLLLPWQVRIPPVNMDYCHNRNPGIIKSSVKPVLCWLKFILSILRWTCLSYEIRLTSLHPHAGLLLGLLTTTILQIIQIVITSCVSFAPVVFVCFAPRPHSHPEGNISIFFIAFCLYCLNMLLNLCFITMINNISVLQKPDSVCTKSFH